MASKQGIPVDAYIRVSRVGDRGDRLISPDLQRASIKRVCEREGLRVVNEYEELDASGGDAKRPMWLEALQRVEEGRTRGIVVWNLSRFSRSVRDALNALDRIEGAGGKLYSEEGNLGKLDRNIRLAIAEDEADRARAGFKNAAASAIARGVYIAARTPFGYIRGEDRRLHPNEDEAFIVRALFERRANGASWKNLSDWAMETHGLKLAKTTLSGMLQNPAYLGHARQGDVVNEKAHEPIVPRLLFDKARKAKGRKPIHVGGHTPLLRGIIRCGTCSRVMVMAGTRGARLPGGGREKRRAYQCRNNFCEHHAYASESVDQFVSDGVLGFLRLSQANMKTAEGKDAQALLEAQKELQEAQYALDQFLANRKAISILGADASNELLEEYMVARDAAQMTVDALEGDEEPSYEEVIEMWKTWTDESRSEYLARIIADCTVDPNPKGKRIPVQERLRLSVSMTREDVEVVAEHRREGKIVFAPD